MLKATKALFLGLLMVLFPLSGCTLNPADGAEGAAECSTTNSDELLCLDIGMPDEEGILRPPIPVSDAHGNHRNSEDDHDHEDLTLDENQTNSTPSRFNTLKRLLVQPARTGLVSHQHVPPTI